MSTLQSALICLVLLGAAIYAAASYDDLDPNEEEWESATATFTKEANGSIITGTNFTPCFFTTTSLFSSN